MTELREVQKRIHKAQDGAYRQGWTAQEALVYVLELVDSLLYRPEKEA